MVKGLDIRLAGRGDVPEIWTLLCACRDDLQAQGIGQWVEQYPNLEVVTADVSDTYLVRMESNLVAVITLNGDADAQYESLTWLAPPGSRFLCVHRLAVNPCYQRRGLGRILMRLAEDQAAARGLASIRLDAYSGNPAALALYDTLGYQRVGSVFFSFRDKPFVCFEKLLNL